MSAATFKFKRRWHTAACSANVPLLSELSLLYEQSAAVDAADGKTRMQRIFEKAIDSISKFPLPIESGAEAEELQGIGAFLSAKIDKLLSKLRQNGGAVAASPIGGVPAAATAATASALAATAAASNSPAVPAVAPLLPAMPSSLPTSSPDAPSIFSATASSHAASPAAPSRPANVSSSSHTDADASVCPYGIECWRTNVVHFREQRHPAEHPMVQLLAESERAKPSPQKKKRARELEVEDDDVVVLSDTDDKLPSSADAPRPSLIANASASPAKRRKPATSEAVRTKADEEQSAAAAVTQLPRPANRNNSSSSAAAAAPTASLAKATSKAAAPPVARVQSLLPGTSKPAKAEKSYKPKVGSSPYALLLALAQLQNANGGLPVTKQQLATAALQFFRVDKQGDADATTTSVWQGMATLVTRDLVEKSLTPIQYSLTDAGRLTAQQLLPQTVAPTINVAAADDDGDFFSPLQSSSQAGGAAAAASPVPAVAAPSAAIASSPFSSPILSNVPLVRKRGSAADFEVCLLVDMRERSGKKDAIYMMEKMRSRGYACEARALNVSDFMWIARHRTYPTIEVVLDCIVERKRVSDLVASVRDGRYQEQRSRLKKTKLQRRIYIIEGQVAEDTVQGLPLKTVESVITSLNGVHGVLVHHTPTIDASLAFLQSLHQLLQDEMVSAGVPLILPQDFEPEMLTAPLQLPMLAEPSLTATTSLLVGSGESFPSFMHRLHKSAHLLAAELFGTQLRMIRGVSAPLALTLLEKYPSVRALCEAYEACPSVEAEEQMLAEVPRGKFQRVTGPALSAKIRAFFRADYH